MKLVSGQTRRICWTCNTGLTPIFRRESIYAYQRPPIDLPSVRLTWRACAAVRPSPKSAAGTARTWRSSPGAVTRADAGRGPIPAGMLRSARMRTADATLVAGDAAALPLADGACDVALAMHMLYHVPTPEAAVRELRRITRSGGQVVVGLNGDDHLRELRDLMVVALADIGYANPPLAPFERIGLDRGQVLLSEVFPK